MHVACRASVSEQWGTPPLPYTPPEQSTPPTFGPKPEEFDTRAPPPHGFGERPGFGQPPAPSPAFAVPGPPLHSDLWLNK